MCKTTYGSAVADSLQWPTDGQLSVFVVGQVPGEEAAVVPTVLLCV